MYFANNMKVMWAFVVVLVLVVVVVVVVVVVAFFNRVLIFDCMSHKFASN